MRISWGPSKSNRLLREAGSQRQPEGETARMGQEPERSRAPGEQDRIRNGTAGREWLRGRGEPQGGLGVGEGPPAGDPVLRAKTGGGRQWSLWVTGSSCHHPICLLACGRRKMEGDRQGLCPPNLSPAPTPALQVFQGKGGAPRTGDQEARFQACWSV